MLHIVSIIVLYSGLPRDNIGICARKIVEYHLDNGNQMANIDWKISKKPKMLVQKKENIISRRKLGIVSPHTSDCVCEWPTKHMSVRLAVQA